MCIAMIGQKGTASREGCIEDDRVDLPVSLYSATKRSDEFMDSVYSIPATGLRFFTVYGPMGCLDMAYFKFVNTLCAGGSTKIYNMGCCRREFTYVDDIVEGVTCMMAAPPEVRIGVDDLLMAVTCVYNIDNPHPEDLLEFVDALSEGYDFEAHRELVPVQPGDVPVNYVDTSRLERDFGFRPSTKLEDGLRAFAKWYRIYYGIYPRQG